MALSTIAIKAFIAWALNKGVVKKPERVPEWLKLMDRLPQMYAAHEAGICHPETSRSADTSETHVRRETMVGRGRRCAHRQTLHQTLMACLQAPETPWWIRGLGPRIWTV